ncbi:hypothetical protein BDW66DRAFT_8334 [Aspergillus desertorum]
MPNLGSARGCMAKFMLDGDRMSSFMARSNCGEFDLTPDVRHEGIRTFGYDLPLSPLLHNGGPWQLSNELFPHAIIKCLERALSRKCPHVVYLVRMWLSNMLLSCRAHNAQDMPLQTLGLFNLSCSCARVDRNSDAHDHYWLSPYDSLATVVAMQRASYPRSYRQEP